MTLSRHELMMHVNSLVWIMHFLILAESREIPNSILLFYGAVLLIFSVLWVVLFCLHSSCISCAQCSQFRWILYSWVPFQLSVTFINIHRFSRWWPYERNILQLHSVICEGCECNLHCSANQRPFWFTQNLIHSSIHWGSHMSSLVQKQNWGILR